MPRRSGTPSGDARRQRARPRPRAGDRRRGPLHDGDRALYATGGSNYRQLPIGVSIACGERVLLPKVRQAPPETTLVSDGFSCRSQIEQASRTGRRALHDAQVIAQFAEVFKEGDPLLRQAFDLLSRARTGFSSDDLAIRGSYASADQLFVGTENEQDTSEFVTFFGNTLLNERSPINL